MNDVRIIATGAACSVPGLLEQGTWDVPFTPVDMASHYEPLADEFVPRNTRRRISRLIAMALFATRDAGGLDAPAGAPLLFASANGEINTIGAILRSLLSDAPSVSPTAFHNSVHNAAPGYWSILAKRLAATSTISQGPLSFEFALLEAWSRMGAGEADVLVCAGDEAIESADWADPGHCTHDFCGALRLSATLGDIEAARLLAVRFLPRGGGWDAMVAGLAREFAPDAVVVGEPHLSGAALLDARHPMAGLACLLRFVRAPGPAGTLLLARRGPDGGIAIVASRGAHG